jgi:hypothetical protein
MTIIIGRMEFVDDGLSSHEELMLEANQQEDFFDYSLGFRRFNLTRSGRKTQQEIRSFPQQGT